MTEETKSKPKVLLAPFNFGNRPRAISTKMKELGYECEHLLYAKDGKHAFGFSADIIVNLSDFPSINEAHIATLQEMLRRDFDIFHFWNKSLVHDASYRFPNGFDIPLLKARGKKLIHEFTGNDLRLKNWDLKLNLHSPYRYGLQYGDEYEGREAIQIAYIEFLKEYCDELVVMDPELAQFLPEAKIIPRALDLTLWPYKGLQKRERPLVIHAPSNSLAKGTPFILSAVEELREEGLSFDFQLLERVPHSEVRKALENADIVIDQILIGATGVLTLEAWALGKPVILNLREDLFCPFYKTTDLPVANANPDTIKSVLRNLVGDYDRRLHLSKIGRTIVERFHDINIIIEDYLELYGRLFSNPQKPVFGSADANYLRRQVDYGMAQLRENNDKLKNTNDQLKTTRDQLMETNNQLKATRDQLKQTIITLRERRDTLKNK